MVDRTCQPRGVASIYICRSCLALLNGAAYDALEKTSIADLQKIPALLSKRGYDAKDIDNIMYGNWLRLLRRTWA